MKFLKNKLPLLAFLMAVAAFTILLTGCQPNHVTPETPMEELDLSVDMDEVEYGEAMQLAMDKQAEQYGANPLAPGYWAFDKTYDLTYDDIVRIAVGGAVYDQTRNEWLGGGSAGNVQIPPDVFAAIDAASPHKIRVQVRNSWFFLRSIRVTYLDQGNQVINGLYNANTREFLFLGGNGGGGQVGNTACGAITIGAVAGNFSGDLSRIENGKYSVGFIAGCVPIFISASAEFTFDGEEATGNTPIDQGSLELSAIE